VIHSQRAHTLLASAHVAPAVLFVEHGQVFCDVDVVCLAEVSIPRPLVTRAFLEATLAGWLLRLEFELRCVIQMTSLTPVAHSAAHLCVTSRHQ
jgi:hypothetical protein